MAQDRKYGKVTAERGDRVHGSPGVPLNESDEPVFILRAQDGTSVATLFAYMQESAKIGAPEEHIAAVDEVISDFMRWQTENHNLVKAPD
jgi:hypothetical protein